MLILCAEYRFESASHFLPLRTIMKEIGHTV